MIYIVENGRNALQMLSIYISCEICEQEGMLVNPSCSFYWELLKKQYVQLIMQYSYFLWFVNVVSIYYHIHFHFKIFIFSIHGTNRWYGASKYCCRSILYTRSVPYETSFLLAPWMNSASPAWHHHSCSPFGHSSHCSVRLSICMLSHHHISTSKVDKLEPPKQDGNSTLVNSKVLKDGGWAITTTTATIKTLGATNKNSHLSQFSTKISYFCQKSELLFTLSVHFWWD